MYRIKNTMTNRFIFGKVRFTTYERARSAARSYIRKLLRLNNDAEVGNIGFNDNISRNPTMLGIYKIVKVD